MPAVMRAADVVLDQFAIGSYGVLAVQAMAAGRIVVGDVTDDVRRHVSDATGMNVPIVQANPETLTSVLRDLADDVETARRSAQAGPDFVAAVHDGALAATVLARALGL
jgi:glycosyltransferase involved in cell wall biosynthesis